MDRVHNLRTMNAELLRLFVPGGVLIGSFTLEEPPPPTEPQTLTEELLADQLLRHLRIETCRTAPKGPGMDTYKYFFESPEPAVAISPRILWVRAVKPTP